jgi:hypothetical protein
MPRRLSYFLTEGVPRFEHVRLVSQSEVLDLFGRSSSAGYRGLYAATSTVAHIAFEIALADYESEKARFESLGVTVTTAEHAWVHWGSLYVFDPDGNEVEWVCYDESIA